MTSTTPPPATRLIEVERDENGRVLMCVGCGTVETVASIRRNHPTAFEAGKAAERERIVAIIDNRRSIYETKRDQSDPFAKDECNRFDKMTHTVEAFGYLLSEIGATVPAAPGKQEGEGAK